MKLLKDILYKVSLTAVSGNMDKEVVDICFDSRKVETDFLFVATKGTQVDGHQFIDKAIALGASVIIAEKLPANPLENITYVEVNDSAEALGIIACNFYNNPSSKLKLLAVTGTNGKTTIATLLYRLFKGLGYNVGLLSTIENRVNDKVMPSTHTTGDAIQINYLLNKMVKAGCTHCFIEASSHAIVQQRLSGLHIDGAIFTNISHDHLDYHQTFESYIKAKKKLFDNLPSTSFALVNVDDKRGRIMLQNTAANKKTYSLKSMSDFKAKVLSNTFQGIELEIDNKNIWFKLIGFFNAYNIVAAYAAAILIDEDGDQVLVQLSDLDNVNGRFEQVSSNSNVTAIVDYAHTPDALKNVLNTVSSIRTKNEQVITVVGCGGNRDTEKRPIMAEIACEGSDKVILTSDNPRDEPPEKIIEDMRRGVSAVNYKKVLAITDRKEAIRTACSLANNNDIILVAGKGHETYQEIQGVKHDFDDKAILKEALKAIED